MFRLALFSDAPALTTLVNLAYEVEAFFKNGPRTFRDEIADMLSRGAFLVREEDGRIVACVYVRAEKERGFLGMLAVHPSHRGLGWGRKLVAAAETHCRDVGCRLMELEVVNLRTELPPFYRALGYTESATTPFPHPARTTKACHMIVMSKEL